MRTSELKDELLDYWVAKAQDKEVLIAGGMAQTLYRVEQGAECYQVYSPSTDWSQGGPIIQRERICITGPGPMGGPDSNLLWTAHIDTGSFAGSKYWRGPTALITAMRAFVGGHFGEEVDDS